MNPPALNIGSTWINNDRRLLEWGNEELFGAIKKLEVSRKYAFRWCWRVRGGSESIANYLFSFRVNPYPSSGGRWHPKAQYPADSSTAAAAEEKSWPRKNCIIHRFPFLLNRYFRSRRLLKSSPPLHSSLRDLGEALAAINLFKVSMTQSKNTKLVNRFPRNARPRA